MFDNLFKTSAPAKTPASGGSFNNLFPTTPAAKPTAISTASSLATLKTPATTISPSTTPNAFANTLGSGYGASNETDSSGKPLLTFINQPAKSSQLLSDRVAPTSNPTVAKPNAVQTTPRMSVASSTAIRSNLGMGTGTELDHIQPLELGGSNEKSNLRPESAVDPSKPYSGANETATDPIENAITAKVNAGKESEAQGWADMAKAKGITLPENGGSVPNINQTQPNLGGNAPQPSLASKVGGFFGGLFDKAKSAGSAVVNGVENAAQTAKDAGLSYLAGVPVSTRKQTPSNSLVFNASPDAITALTTGKNAPVPAAGPASPLQFATDLPKNIVQGATRSALGFGKTLLGEDQPSQPGEINASKLSPIEQLATYGKEPVGPLVDSATVAAARQGNPKALGGLGLAGLGLSANVTLDPGTWGDDALAKLAQETDAEKIVSILTAKGVEEDGARSIAPILARAQTPEQVKAVLQTAANRGIIMNGAKDVGTTAADEFAAQKGGEAAAEDTTPKALSAPTEALASPASSEIKPAISNESPLAPIKTPPLSNGILKDLQPLADEAKKYPTAQEFSDAIIHDKGGVGSGVEYSPAKRLVETGINDTPLTNFGFKPEDKVTIYRGVDRASQKAIAPGDYIATSYDLAKSYTGGKVISQEVPASTVRFASSDGITPNDFRKGFNETHLEGVYNPTAPLKATQLEDFYNKATGKVLSPTSLAPVSDKYQIFNAQKYKYEAVPNAKPINLVPNVDTFVHPSKDGEGFTISEGKTGHLIAQGDTVQEAKDKALALFQNAEKKHGMTPEQVVNEAVTRAKAGPGKLSPRYEGESAEKPLTQKEMVAKQVQEGPKTIKEIADNTKILEPNVRRILGVGAKDGTFKRVDKGVYVLDDGKGNEMAYVEAGDAKDVLARMADEGKKFHSVILDPAYKSDALIGRGRGVLKQGIKSRGIAGSKAWDFILPEDFASVMKSISRLVADDQSHVYLMLSGARTAQDDMAKYVDGAVNAGFKAVGEGGYTKLDKSGKPVLNVRGVEAAPERIILLTKSGTAKAGEISTDLNFRYVRPSIAKSYRTEKPAELMRALIQRSTLEGEKVLDPFAGSGVTGEQAIQTGRKPTLIEKSQEQVENGIVPRLEKASKGSVGNFIKKNTPEVPRPPVKTTPADNTIKENFLNRVRETASPTEFEKNAKGLGKEKVPEVQTDEQSLAEAGAKTVAGKGTKVGGLDKDTRKIYQDWANYRGQSNKAISGRMASAPFESLRKSGMDAVHAFQDGDRSGQLEAVDKWGKTLLAKEQEAGIPVESRANYLPQYWANSEAEIKAAQDKFVNDNPGKRVSLTPGFSREATFPDYKTGEEYGLTPKYNNIPDMINARVRASEQALADRALFDNLAKHNLVVPSSRAPEGWKTLNPDKYPRFAINAGGQVFHGTVSAPGPLADLINAQLRGTESQTDRMFQATAKWATKLKTVVLGSGIPGTAIQFHAFNELAATVPELFNQPTLFTTALQYMFHPNSAEGFINANLPMAQEAARSGLVLGGEEIALDSLAQQAVNKGVVKTVAGLFQKGEDLLYKVFAKNTFEKMVPALKLRMWADTKDFLIDQGMNATDAARNAANRANQTFGGLNYAALGRDPNLQNMIRTFIFAPDFWEARFKYAGNMGKGLVGKGPMSKLYRNAALTVLGAYVAMNVANKKTSGKWMFQNPAGHSMDIYGGTDSAGKNIWIRPFGTDLDFARLPMDIAQSIVQTGDLSGIGTDARNRVSTLLQPLLTLVTNSDAYGNKIFQPATTANPLWGQIATFASTLPVVPQVGVGIAGLFTPGTSKEEAISKAAGLPVKFNSPTTPTTSQLADMIYTERPQLESEIKKDYLAGNTSDAYNKMAQFNQDLVNVTIKAYQDNGHTITDRQAFINFLATHTQAEGGLKGLLVMPPTQKVMNTAKQKQGQPLFNKIFPSNITSSTQ